MDVSMDEGLSQWNFISLYNERYESMTIFSHFQRSDSGYIVLIFSGTSKYGFKQLPNKNDKAKK